MSSLAEVPVGEEAELQRCHGALDGHVDDADHEPTPVEPLEGIVQGDGSLGRVEGEHLLHPARAGKPFGLLRYQGCAGSDDEDVVVEPRPVTEPHSLGFEVDVVHGCSAVADVAMELAPAGAGDLVEVRQAEGHEQEARLVDVGIVLIHHDDLDVVVQGVTQPVGRQCPAGAPSEDDDARAHGFSLASDGAIE